MSIEIIKAGKLEYLTATGIGARHCFTTRRGGVSTGVLESLNLTHHRGDCPQNVEENYKILSRELGFSLNNMVLTRQTHSDIVRLVTAADAMGTDHHRYPECDGLITNTPGTALVVFTADCTPILLWDSVTGAVGAVHAGWRGTALDIVGKTVQAMEAAFGSRPADIHAAIGPNIGQCCFETDADVPLAMEKIYGQVAAEWICSSADKYYVNLKAINALALRRAGVEQIDISTHCTACQPDLYWSHRRTGQARGSQGALIIREEGVR